MIEPMQGLPDHVVAIAASGEVSARDYETVLVPAVEAALARHEKIRLLYQLGGDFTGFTAGAMWDDMKVGLDHFTKWERIAVVTDLRWVANATRMFRFAMPCPVRVFANAELAEARRWIAA